MTRRILKRIDGVLRDVTQDPNGDWVEVPKEPYARQKRTADFEAINAMTIAEATTAIAELGLDDMELLRMLDHEASKKGTREAADSRIQAIREETAGTPDHDLPEEE